MLISSMRQGGVTLPHSPSVINPAADFQVPVLSCNTKGFNQIVKIHMARPHRRPAVKMMAPPFSEHLQL